MFEGEEGHVLEEQGPRLSPAGSYALARVGQVKLFPVEKEGRTDEGVKAGESTEKYHNVIESHRR